MTTEEDVKELKEDLEEIKNYPIKLSYKQLWIVITTIITIIGSSFGVGIKVEHEAQKIIQAKLEQKHIQEINKKDLEYIDLEKIAKSYEADSKFFKREYEKVSTRLEECQKGDVYTQLFKEKDK